MSVEKWMASASRASLACSRGDAVEVAGAGEVDGDGEQQDQERPDGERKNQVLTVE